LTDYGSYSSTTEDPWRLSRSPWQGLNQVSYLLPSKIARAQITSKRVLRA